MFGSEGNVLLEVHNPRGICVEGNGSKILAADSDDPCVPSNPP